MLSAIFFPPLNKWYHGINCKILHLFCKSEKKILQKLLQNSK